MVKIDQTCLVSNNGENMVVLYNFENNSFFEIIHNGRLMMINLSEFSLKDLTLIKEHIYKEIDNKLKGESNETE